MSTVPKHPFRSFKRRPAEIPVLLSVGDKAPEPLLTASVVDLSFLGMRVRAEAPLEPGQKVNITPITGPQAPVPGQVVWVGARGSNAEGHAGLRYINPMHARIAPR